MLARARRFGGNRCVFPSVRGDKPMVETAVARAVHRNMAHFGLEPFTPHDLRRTAATQMSISIDRVALAKILNHAETGVTGIYDRYSYDAEKRLALDGWGAKVAELMND